MPHAFVMAWLLATLCALAVVLTAITVLLNLRSGVFGFDFHGTIWTPGRAILHGTTPYPIADADALKEQGNPSVYPPPVLLAAVPLDLLSAGTAAVVWSAISLASLIGALVLAGLRDWRGYVLLLATPAVCSMVILGQMEGILALGCVIAWRARDRAIVTGIAVALIVAAKLFLAPIIIWLIATRRYAAALVASGGAALCCLGAWAVIGFDGLRTYPALLAADTRAFQSTGESLVGLETRLGLSGTLVRPLALCAGLALAATIVAAAHGHNGDRRAFVTAIATGVALSPIVWLHYFVLIFLGVALMRPRVDVVWIAMFLTWVATTEHDSTWRATSAIAAIAFMVAANLTTRGQTTPRRIRPEANAATAIH